MANEKEKILNTRIKLKIATYAEWTDESQALKGANFVLKRGEIGLCEIPAGNTEATTAPTVLFKVGDGTNAFKDLKWASALAADVYGWAKKSEDEFKEWAGTNIDTDTDTRYSFAKVDDEDDENYGKLKITAQRYNVKTSQNIGNAAVSYVDLVTPEELEKILKDYVKSVDKKANTAIEVTYATDDTNKQNPKVGLILDATSSNAKGGTAVKLSQSNSGLKAEVDLSNFATKDEIQTDFGVLSVTGDQVVVASPVKGDVVLETKLDNSGNVKFSKTTDGLKGTVDLTHNHDNQYAPKDHDHSKYVVTVDTTTTVEDGVLKHYIFKQDNKEIAHIDIPKDLVVSSGSVETVTEANKPYKDAVVGDKYIKLEIANQETPLYIPAKSLVDIYTAQEKATQVQLDISATNEISATIVAGSITTTELAKSVQESLTKADGANAYTDAEIKKLDVTVTGMGAGKTIATLTETDGKIAATFQDIAITKTQITDFSDDDYAKPSDLNNTIVSVERRLETSMIPDVGTDGQINETDVDSVDTPLYITTKNGAESMVDTHALAGGEGIQLSITASSLDNTTTTIRVADKGITTAKIADHAVGAAQIKAEKGYTGTDAEIWVFDCGGAE